MSRNEVKQYQRQNMRHMLALAWLKEHRMDVYEAIQQEVWKKFPAANGHKVASKTVLPNSLKRLR